MELAPLLMPRGIVFSLDAIARDVNDPLRLVCLETLRQLVVFNVSICCLPPWVSCYLLSSVFCFLSFVFWSSVFSLGFLFFFCWDITFLLDINIALSNADFGSPSSHKYPSRNIISSMLMWIFTPSDGWQTAAWIWAKALLIWILAWVKFLPTLS